MPGLPLRVAYACSGSVYVVGRAEPSHLLFDGITCLVTFRVISDLAVTLLNRVMYTRGTYYLNN